MVGGGLGNQTDFVTDCSRLTIHQYFITEQWLCSTYSILLEFTLYHHWRAEFLQSTYPIWVTNSNCVTIPGCVLLFFCYPLTKRDVDGGGHRPQSVSNHLSHLPGQRSALLLLQHVCTDITTR